MNMMWTQPTGCRMTLVTPIDLSVNGNCYDLEGDLTMYRHPRLFNMEGNMGLAQPSKWLRQFLRHQQGVQVFQLAFTTFRAFFRENCVHFIYSNKMFTRSVFTTG